jgi:hypothetical protein
METESKPVVEVDITKPANAQVAPPQKPNVVASREQASASASAAQPLLSTEAFMANLPQVLREWFAAVVGDPNFDNVRTHFVVTELGVEIPAKLLGKYGVQGQTIRKLLEDAKVITGRSDDGTRFVFDSAVKGYLFKEQADAA